MTPSRLHGLIDGVFAIAITLLVLDLPKPAGSERLAHDLLQAWPSYAAYLVAFVTVGVIWIEHHGMMSAVRAIDRRFLERSLLFLLFVSLIPWPTALAAEYATEAAQARTAAIVFATLMMCMGLSFALSWRYLERHPELVDESARPAIHGGTRRAVAGGLVYLIAIAVALISPRASFAIDAAIALYFAISSTDVPGLISRKQKGSA